MTAPDPSSVHPVSTLGRLRVSLLGQLARRNIEVIEEHPDHLVVLHHGRRHSMYLGNLARALDVSNDPRQGRGHPSQRRLDDAVEEWIELNLRQMISRRQIQQNYPTLDSVRDRLLPRLVSAGWPGETAPRWGRPICGEQLELALVIDQGESVVFAMPEMVQRWGPGDAEAVAMANLRRLCSPQDLTPLAEAAGIRVCAVNDTFAAARALVIEQLLPGQCPLGVLLAAPCRDLLFVEPLSRDAIGDIIYMSMLARRSMEELPYPLSGEVFWVRQASWQHVPIRLGDGQIEITPSAEFARLLEDLLDEDDPAR